jgi:hypothetical protein
MTEKFSEMHDLRDALRSDFERGQREHGLSAAMVANAFGKSPTSSWPYQLMTCEVPMHVPMIRQWQQLTGGDKLTEWVCGKSFICTPIIELKRHKSTANTLREFAEFVEATADAQEDGTITAAELERIDRESREAISAILAEVRGFHERAKQDRTGRVRTLREVG